MLEIISFYRLEDLKNGGFNNLMDELQNEGYTYINSLTMINSYFKLS